MTEDKKYSKQENSIWNYSRRKFLQSGYFILPTLHLGLMSSSCAGPNKDSIKTDFNTIKRIELEVDASKMRAQKRFYTQVLRLPLLSETNNAFEVMAGDSVVKFRGAETNAFYHFAFNIPSNKIKAAAEWSQGKFDLLTNRFGDYIIHFSHWNADAIYFYDPAGNIVEFIAHQPSQNHAPGSFTEQDILFVCEMGIVSGQVRELANEIERKVGFTDYIKGWTKSNFFRALGNPMGMLILSKTGREWLMTSREAEEYEVNITLKTGVNQNLNLDNAGAHIQLVE